MKQWHIYVYKDPSGYVSFMYMHVCKHRLAKTKVHNFIRNKSNNNLYNMMSAKSFGLYIS